MLTTSTARNLINGVWSDTGSVHESICPSTGEVIGAYVSAGRAEAQAAVTAARFTFDTTDWSRSPSLRSRALNELADRLAEQAPAIARMLAQENGKLLAQTTWEVLTSVEWLRYSAASALVQIAGRAAEPTPGSYYHSVPEAAGVAGIIVPWNSPVILLVRALGPAIGAGCTTVVKMPGQTALTNAVFAEAVAATMSLPAGVVNILTEAGNEVAPLLIASPDIDVISYTGSTHVGRAIAAAAAPTPKRLGLELGGKTPLIVFDDADLDIAVHTLVMSSILMNGEFCCTGSRSTSPSSSRRCSARSRPSKSSTTRPTRSSERTQPSSAWPPPCSPSTTCGPAASHATCASVASGSTPGARCPSTSNRAA